MKKILIAEGTLASVAGETSFLRRSDIMLFTAATNNEVLALHRAERVDLIIAPLDLPGMTSEQLYATIRNDRDLRAVSTIVLCEDRASDRARCEACKPNAVMTMPLNSSLLIEKAQQLLSISWRESYRVLLNVNIEGSSKDSSFFCSSENISTTGILIETNKVLTKGDRLMCSFFLPGAKQIKASGEIIRVTQKEGSAKLYRYGINFIKLNDEAKASIEDFIEKKTQISTSRK
ncbi:MAG TPA: PilZ domain-containing protein [Nitrospirota bacterium]